MAQTQRITSLFLFFVFLGVTGKGRGYFQINSSLHPVPFPKGHGEIFSSHPRCGAWAKISEGEHDPRESEGRLLSPKRLVHLRELLRLLLPSG